MVTVNVMDEQIRYKQRIIEVWDCKYPPFHRNTEEVDWTIIVDCETRIKKKKQIRNSGLKAEILEKCVALVWGRETCLGGEYTTSLWQNKEPEGRLRHGTQTSDVVRLRNRWADVFKQCIGAGRGTHKSRRAWNLSSKRTMCVCECVRAKFSQFLWTMGTKCIEVDMENYATS